MKKIDLLSQPFALPDGIDMEDYVVATYYLCYPADLSIYKIAPALAIEQSTGTWIPVPEETPDVRRKHLAKVISIIEIPNYEFALERGTDFRNYVIQIAFPVTNIEQQIPMLLTATIGNISLAGKLKLVDLRLPEKYLSGFTGPKFGIKGIRDLLSVQERPLLNNMIKPCTGYPVEVGEKLFFEAAIGGADIIKDDELLANMSFNKSSERVKRYLVLAKKKYEETGEKTLYTVNITDDVPKIFENANRAVELGANAIMINYLAVGLTVLKALSEDKKINVPVLAHMDVAGAMYESPYSGISSHLVLGKLPRLAGADIVVFPAPYGKAPILPERYLHIANTLTYPMKNIKETWPMPSGGITPQVVSKVIKDLGTDIIIGTGGGIHAHPRGPRAGAKAFRQAIDAAMKGVSIEEAAKQHEELRVALEGVKPSLDTFL